MLLVWDIWAKSQSNSTIRTISTTFGMGLVCVQSLVKFQGQEGRFLWGEEFHEGPTALQRTPTPRVGVGRTEILQSSPGRSQNICCNISRKSSKTPEQLDRRKITAQHTVVSFSQINSCQKVGSLIEDHLCWRGLSCVCPPLCCCSSSLLALFPTDSRVKASSAHQPSLIQWAASQTGYTTSAPPPTSLQPWIVLAMRHRFDVHIALFIAFPSVSQSTLHPLRWHLQQLFTTLHRDSGVWRGLDSFLQTGFVKRNESNNWSLCSLTYCVINCFSTPTHKWKKGSWKFWSPPHPTQEYEALGSLEKQLSLGLCVFG